MAITIPPITNDADYDRAVARLTSTMNVPLMSDEEEEELRLLGDEAERYARTRFEFLQVELDGADEVIGALDYRGLTLDDLMPVFGGPERLVEFLTRQIELDDATLEALVTEFGLDRARLEGPYTSQPGWDDISPDGQEPCDDAECCTPGERNWRVVLSGMVGVTAGSVPDLSARELAGV